LVKALVYLVSYLRPKAA